MRRPRAGLFVAPRLPLALAAAAVPAVLLPGPKWLVFAALNLAIVAVAAADVWRAPPPDDLDPAREAPDVVSLDRPAQGTLRLHNPTARSLRVDAHDAAVPSTGLTPLRRSATLAPGAWTELAEDIAPTRRGRATIGPLTLRTWGPAGLAGRQRTLDLTHALKCYPALPGRRQVELRLDRARFLQSGERTTNLRGGGAEFDSLREYHPDDEFRRINWRATARGTRTISNTYREERNQQILLLVDASRIMAGTVAGVPRFEHTLDAGIALAELAGRVGDHVGMAAFGASVLVSMTPRTGRTQARRILEQLFDVQPSLDAPNYGQAFAAVLARNRRRALLVLLTDLADEAAMEGVFSALPVLLARHLVVVAAVTDPEVEGAASAVPATSEEAYRKAAAAGALEARARTAARLGMLGATVVDRPPATLAGALADQYLSIKSQGRL